MPSGRKATNRIRHPRRDCSGGRRIKNSSVRGRPAEEVSVRTVAWLARDQVRQIGVIAVALSSSWNTVGEHRPLPHAQALVIAEEKGLVLLDGTTEGDSKLVLPIRTLLYTARVFKPVRGVHLIVAEEFPEGAM